MTSARRITWACGLALAVGIAWTGSPVRAADKAAGNNAVENKTVDLFDGIKSGDLDVKFIAKNSRDGQVLIKNNTDQPLTVKLPDAFAAVPVLAQNGVAGGGGNRTNNRNSRNNGTNNQNQGVGGGLGGIGGGGAGGIGGGGAFDVAPEKVAKIKVETVCLEHGKKEPTQTVPYEIRPIDSFTTDAKVQELCKLLGTGEINQKAAQAAAWHLANHMTWEQLMDKKTHHLLGGDEIYFTAAEIHAAIQITDRAMKAADARETKSSEAVADTTAASSGK